MVAPVKGIFYGDALCKPCLKVFTVMIEEGTKDANKIQCPICMQHTAELVTDDSTKNL